MLLVDQRNAADLNDADHNNQVNGAIRFGNMFVINAIVDAANTKRRFSALLQERGFRSHVFDKLRAMFALRISRPT